MFLKKFDIMGLWLGRTSLYFWDGTENVVEPNTARVCNLFMINKAFLDTP